MPKHIGIVACSAEGAALCYQTICKEGSEIMGHHAHPEVSMHTHPLSDYMECIYEENWAGVADLMVSSSEKLNKAGADFLICPDNTIHQAYHFVIDRSPLPWLHIAEVVGNEIRKNKYNEVGILGTKYLMTGPVYPEVLDRIKIQYQIPDSMIGEEIDQIIFNELVYGIIKPESKRLFLETVGQLKSAGCDAVILGCTEIPLIILPGESPLPVLDSTRLLARAALKKAFED